MQYTADDIERAIARHEIIVTPYNRRANLKDNFLELHLGRNIAIISGMVDCASELPPGQVERHSMPASGQILPANTLVLGVTHEWTRFFNCQAQLHGKSSLGRLGLAVHITAGIGDAGFAGHWTLEMLCPHPIVVYPGMPIAQIEVRGFARGAAPTPYAGGYCNSPEEDPKPQLSRMHLKRNTADWLTL